MTATTELLADLSRRGIQLRARDGRLEYRPRQAVDPALAGRLAEHRDDLLQILADPEDDQPSPEDDQDDHLGKLIIFEGNQTSTGEPRPVGLIGRGFPAIPIRTPPEAIRGRPWWSVVHPHEDFANEDRP